MRASGGSQAKWTTNPSQDERVTHDDGPDRSVSDFLDLYSVTQSLQRYESPADSCIFLAFVQVISSEFLVWFAPLEDVVGDYEDRVCHCHSGTACPSPGSDPVVLGADRYESLVRAAA